MRHTIVFSLCCFFALALSSCVPETSQTVSRQPKKKEQVPEESSAPAKLDPQVLATRSFREAPMLAERVATGELPPVSERLPENPRIIRPLHETGKYGGTIRRLINDDAGRTGVVKTLNESLVGFSHPFGQTMDLDLASDYTFEDEGRTAIFHLRKGVKWSDGHPFTADDFVFWYVDTKLDLEASQSALPPSSWIIDGKPIKVEKIDDTTLRFSATKPMGRLLNTMAFEKSILPFHYFAKLHPRYNPEATYEGFRRVESGPSLEFDPGTPRLSAWVSTQWVKSQRILFERNPYYWKVDTEGNQLPYADYISFTYVPDPEVMLIKFVNGEFDLFGRYASPDFSDVLYANKAKGNYTIHAKEPDSGFGIYLNWSCKDPVLREAFRNKSVRLALSHGINREEISEIVFKGSFIPGGYSFSPSSRYYDAASYKNHTKYDPVYSGRLLDEAGYRDSDGDGLRELPDGTPFEFVLDIGNVPFQMDMAELIIEQWKEIGVKAHPLLIPEETHNARRVAGDFDTTLWGINGSINPFSAMHFWSITSPGEPMWYRTASEEQPAWLVEVTNIFQEAVATIDPGRVDELMARVRKISKEQIPVIGVGSVVSLWAASDRLGNVPAKGNFDNIYLGWSRPVFHEQLYFKSP